MTEKRLRKPASLQASLQGLFAALLPSMSPYLAVLLTLPSLGSLQAQIRNPKNVYYTWKTDTTIHTVNLDEITIALPKGSFAVIDYPEFIGKDDGLTEFYQYEPVLSVEINGKSKAYPLNMFTVHEISNDSLGGIPILPTYCPLCNSGIVFNRSLRHSGKDYVLEFEVSGMLRKSDMVMLDRKTESLWQQAMGTAIVGELAGAELDVIPSLIISVEEYFNRYPDGLILSKEAGSEEMQKHYGKNYYVHYDAPGSTPYSRYFNEDDINSRLPAMERVVDISDGDDYKIYPFSVVAEKGVINDRFKSKHIVVFYMPGTISILDANDIKASKDIGSVTVFNAVLDGEILTFTKKGKVILDDQTSSTWNITGECIAGPMEGKQLSIEPHSNHFAFAWSAFHPESAFYGD